MVCEIQVSMLSDPVVDGTVQEEYLGRGSSGVVKLQMYRGLYAAVKELNVRSVKVPKFCIMTLRMTTLYWESLQAVQSSS